MSGVRGNTVTNPADPKQNKDAVDAIYNFYTPQYLVLVGSVDVIPHQRMVNPAPDEDPAVPSGLPYACASPYSQETGDFVGPSRVVSRRYIGVQALAVDEIPQGSVLKSVAFSLSISSQKRW